jgi:hypothetical protein
MQLFVYGIKRVWDNAWLFVQLASVSIDAETVLDGDNFASIGKMCETVLTVKVFSFHMCLFLISITGALIGVGRFYKSYCKSNNGYKAENRAFYNSQVQVEEVKEVEEVEVEPG